MREKESKTIELNDLDDINFVKDVDVDNLFTDLEDIASIKEKILKTFDGVYLLDVAPGDIGKYKDNKDVYKILSHYVANNAAENKNIQIVFFKINKDGLNKMKRCYEDYKKKYGNLVIENNNKYYMIVGYYGGSMGRNVQYLIKNIEKEIDIIRIK